MSKALSGKSGNVSKGMQKICDVTKWTVELTADVNKYASNCTDGFKRTVPGNSDWKGTIEVKVTPDTKLQFLPGAEANVTLELGGGNTISGPVVIASVPTEVDIDGGAPVSVTYNFEGDGAYLLAGVFAGGTPTCCVESSSGE